MKKSILFLSLMVLVFSPAFLQAKSDYIYRSRMNWVKLMKLSKKQLAGVELKHPHIQINVPQMEAMLLSIQMSKGSLFKSELKTSEVFTHEEARKYAPLIVKALSKANPNEVVNMSMVHRKTKYLIRNNYLSMINIFVTDEGLHFYFGKIYAKLDGDYQDVSRMSATLRRTKSLRVNLEASEGQKLAFSDANEIILDPNYDFISKTRLAEVEPTKKERKKSKKQKKSDDMVSESVKDRLIKLDKLKDEGLISDKEYDDKRAEILSEL